MESIKSELDKKLSDPVLFKELTQDPQFYKNYEIENTKLNNKEKEWESLVSQLTKLNPL